MYEPDEDERIDSKEVPDIMYDRLTTDPSTSSVPNSLPVLFFGDIFEAKIVTIGINPSPREYLNSRGKELVGSQQRLHTLTSVGATNRASLSDYQCRGAIDAMRMYFRANPYNQYFDRLDNVLMGCNYQVYLDGEIAHADLVQEVTDKPWGDLEAVDKEQLWASDPDFLFKLISWRAQPYGLVAILCDGKTAWDKVQEMTGGELKEQGTFKRRDWYVGTATISGTTLGLAGWNIPLYQRPGLTSEDQWKLGALLGTTLNEYKLNEYGTGFFNVVDEPY